MSLSLGLSKIVILAWLPDDPLAGRLSSGGFTFLDSFLPFLLADIEIIIKLGQLLFARAGKTFPLKKASAKRACFMIHVGLISFTGPPCHQPVLPKCCFLFVHSGFIQSYLVNMSFNSFSQSGCFSYSERYLATYSTTVFCQKLERYLQPISNNSSTDI